MTERFSSFPFPCFPMMVDAEDARFYPIASSKGQIETASVHVETTVLLALHFFISFSFWLICKGFLKYLFR